MIKINFCMEDCQFVTGTNYPHREINLSELVWLEEIRLKENNAYLGSL